jgi:AI-2 transport protein TqsA
MQQDLPKLPEITIFDVQSGHTQPPHLNPKQPMKSSRGAKEGILGEIRLANVAHWMVILAAITVGLIYFSNILKPFLIALFLWYLIMELQRALGRLSFRGRSMPRWLSGIMAFALILSLITSIGEIIQYNIQEIIAQVPFYQQKINLLYQDYSVLMEDSEIAAMMLGWLRELDLGGMLTSLLNSLTGILGNFALILLYIVFLLMENSVLAAKSEALFINRKRSYRMMVSVFRQINSSFRRYLVVKTLISVGTAVLSYIVLRIFDVDFPVLWAFLIFLFNYIPYIGSLVATLLPAVFAVFQYGDLSTAFWVLICIEGIQILMGNYIEPLVMGRSLNLSPLVVMLFLVFWGAIWGIVGMFLSVPIASIMLIVFSHFSTTRPLAILFSERGELTVEEFTDWSGSGN